MNNLFRIHPQPEGRITLRELTPNEGAGSLYAVRTRLNHREEPLIALGKRRPDGLPAFIHAPLTSPKSALLILLRIHGDIAIIVLIYVNRLIQNHLIASLIKRRRMPLEGPNGNSVCPPVAAALVRANLGQQQVEEVAA